MDTTPNTDVTFVEQANGGVVAVQNRMVNAPIMREFTGFKPEAMQRIANTMGYQGDMNNFNSFLQQNPEANKKMNYYTDAARKMAKGGLLKAQEGTYVSPTPLGQQYIPQQDFSEDQNIVEVMATRAKTPGLPTGATVVPVGTTYEAGQFISPTSGQVTGNIAIPTAMATTATATMPKTTSAAQYTAAETGTAADMAMRTVEAAQGTVDPRANILAAEQTASSVGNLNAAQGNAILMDNPVQRQIQDGELVSGVANAQTAATFTEQIQAAEATPSKQATVQGQLEGLMTQFEGGATPEWAAGAMRAATATMAARGLGASSLAGQAVVQAAMESALPIAAADAQTIAQFEAQNLSNRQQRAMLAAQQRAAFIGQEFDQAFQARVANASRIADVANMNFTAEQQVALENSRIANTTNLQNLSNRQAKVMAEAAALANLDMANLNNRQQAAVQNAQNFLQMDLTNLNNEQQTGLFRAQQNIQALFTDQAAQNAALQFNAASENQTNQFFSNLNAQVSQFNATQKNAMDQFNVNSVNAMRQFNSEVQQQRDLFNAQNGLVVAQANAQWRQNIATLNTAAMNQSNMDFAKTINALTSTNLDQIWQRERDIMSYSFTASETAKDRALNILLADKDLAAYREKMAADESNAMWAVGARLLFGFGD